MKLTKVASVNSVTKTFTFTHIDEVVVPNFKKWYFDLSMIGRHFLVYTESDPHTKRHYTICNTMQPSLLEALRKLGDSTPQTFN